MHFFFLPLANLTACNFRMPNPNMNSTNLMAFYVCYKHSFSTAVDFLIDKCIFKNKNTPSRISNITTAIKGISFNFIIEIYQNYEY